MNIYAIYINSGQNKNDFVIVKDGFSLTASLFNVFWAFYHKMWLPLFISIVISVIVAAVNIQELTIIFKITIMLVFGFFAQDIREMDLKRKKYQLEDVIVASTEIEAELKFLERN